MSSPVANTALVAAQTQARTAAAIGFNTCARANDAAWATLWSGRIDVIGNPTLASEVNASEFYLWSSHRDGVDWSISPAGLSSNSYNGHIFWDAETWMYPALLAQHPDLANGDERLQISATGGGPEACHGHRLPGSPLPLGKRARR